MEIPNKIGWFPLPTSHDAETDNLNSITKHLSAEQHLSPDNSSSCTVLSAQYHVPYLQKKSYLV